MLTTAYWACSVLGVGLAIAAIVRRIRDVGERRRIGIERLATDAEHRLRSGTEAMGVAAGGLDAEVAGDTPEACDELPTPSVWVRWFSMRFWYGATAVFGLLGVWLTYDSTLTVSAVFWIAVSSGLVFGQLLHQIGRLLTPHTDPDETEADA